MRHIDFDDLWKNHLFDYKDGDLLVIDDITRMNLSDYENTPLAFVMAVFCAEGRAEMQNDLILDYRSNVALYPEFQKYLRTYQPPLLAVWGENDLSFIPAGANAFRRDVPNAEIHFVPSGHFALESHHAEIAKLMHDFLARTIN